MIITKQTSKLANGSEVFNLKVDDDDIVVTFNCKSRSAMEALADEICHYTMNVEEVLDEVQN